MGYAPIEKELLAVVYGMERFHYYTYGRKVVVNSDHKPLESIVRKPLHMAPKKLQDFRVGDLLSHIESSILER